MERQLIDLSQGSDQAGVLVDKRGSWGAIAIGSDSDLDRCWIIPEGRSEPIHTVAGATPPNRLQAPFQNAIKVSVERPLIGPITGPFRVLFPYARDVQGTVRGHTNFTSAITLPFPMQLALDFYDCIPPFLPTARAPFERTFRVANPDGAAIYVPGYGRKNLSLSIELSGRTTGSLDWDFAGGNYVVFPSGSDIDNHHYLQASTTESADFDRTYTFDGEFDYYVLSHTNNALDAAAVLSGVIKAWD